MNKMRVLSKEPFGSVKAGIQRLDSIRKAIYEDLNQIQHEAMALKAVLYLEKNNASARVNMQWSWNPRQGGGASEPDVRGIRDGRTVISAEITTSEKPNGVIDSRMRDTLAKLNRMQGKKYYFVKSPEMERRANTKARRNGFNIRIVKI